MIIQEQTAVDLATPTGPMRTYVFRPVVKGKYPAVILFSEIFQATGPIRRFAAFIAGHGYIVAVPEVYHELEPAGTVLPYDQAGSDRGNADKYGKAVSAYASDIHSPSLGLGKHDDTLQRAGEIKGELLHIWGRQDPHVPLAGRDLIKARLEEVGANFQWLEVNGAHAFMRDEGYRYDPELAEICMHMTLALLHRKLAL